jgi:hypothetical protein
MPTKRRPFTPAPYEVADVTAIHQLEKGEAGPEMQKRALAWIIAISGTYDQSYHDTERDTCFAEGKRWVGNSIVKMLKLNPRGLRSQK